MNRTMKSIVVISLMLALALLIPACAEWWRRDACLDSSGAWNNETETCER